MSWLDWLYEMSMKPYLFWGLPIIIAVVIEIGRLAVKGLRQDLRESNAQKGTNEP